MASVTTTLSLNYPLVERVLARVAMMLAPRDDGRIVESKKTVLEDVGDADVALLGQEYDTTVRVYKQTLQLRSV